MLDRIFSHLIAPKAALALATLEARKRGLSAFQVVGANMAPTIEPGEVAWYDASLGAKVPCRGKVVAWRLTDSGSALVPCRVVGVPGDTVEIRDGTLLVNRDVIDETYLQFGRAEQDHSRASPPASVPTGHLWLLGDFRDMSKDSRNIGAIPLSAVVGRITHVHQRGGHAHPREVR